MLVLASGANYFVMFVGWEGISQCLKWVNVILFSNLYFLCEIEDVHLLYVIFPLSVDSKLKLGSNHRIGPHNTDIISIIIGSVLGDSHLEKRNKGLGTRIISEQSNTNVEYLMYFHSYLSIRGYCNPQKPKLHTRIKKR